MTSSKPDEANEDTVWKNSSLIGKIDEFNFILGTSTLQKAQTFEIQIPSRILTKLMLWIFIFYKLSKLSKLYTLYKLSNLQISQTFQTAQTF